jgi:hypothetical protein
LPQRPPIGAAAGRTNFLSADFGKRGVKPRLKVNLKPGTVEFIGNPGRYKKKSRPFWDDARVIQW